MRRVTTVEDYRKALSELPRPLGLVLTMGALHQGHMTLVRQARADNASVAATIFVNPLQFGANEDLDRYPRPIERDLDMLAAGGVDLVFTPTVEEMYKPGFGTAVQVGGPSQGYEGDVRPGHFTGVATVVTKLLLQALPDVAYFGRKDAQQVAVVRRLVQDLDIPVRLHVMPIHREPDGLAMSSRNAYLTLEERVAAPTLFRALSSARDRYRSGTQTADKLIEGVRAILDSEPRFERIDYVAIVDEETFTPWSGKGPALLAAAVRIGKVRLIDNVVLD
jgi:pantoate--beta-alanine ligase